MFLHMAGALAHVNNTVEMALPSSCLMHTVILYASLLLVTLMA